MSDEDWKPKKVLDLDSLEVQFPSDMPKTFIQVFTLGNIFDLSNAEWARVKEAAGGENTEALPFGRGSQVVTDIYGRQLELNMGMIEAAREWTQAAAQKFLKWNRWRIQLQEMDDEEDE